MTSSADVTALGAAELKVGVELSAEASKNWDVLAPLAFWGGKLTVESRGDFAQMCELRVVVDAMLATPHPECTLNETRALPFLLELIDRYHLQFGLVPTGRPNGSGLVM